MIAALSLHVSTIKVMDYRANWAALPIGRPRVSLMSDERVSAQFLHMTLDESGTLLTNRSRSGYSGN
jgi:hypothetical protein